MQEIAPEEYRKYRDYAVNLLAGPSGSSALVDKDMPKATCSVQLNTEEAMDEIAADFTREMLDDEKLFRDLTRSDRTVAGKLLDAIRDFIRRVKSSFSGRERQDREAMRGYGVSMDKLEQAEKLWQAAYDTAAQEAVQRTLQDGNGKWYNEK